MKLFIKIFSALIAVLILAVVVLLITIDPNDYKEEIQAQVKKSINRELVINGDISWSFYPQLGFNLDGIELNNLDGFNRKHLVKIDNTALGLAVAPLFKGEIQLAEITLDGLVLNLITNKDGKSNLDNMFPETAPQKIEEQKAEKQPETQTNGFFDLEKMQLAGINIKNVQIEVQDLQVNSTTKVDIDHIHLGKFILGQDTDLSVVTDLLLGEMNAHVDLQAKLNVSQDLSSLRLNDLNLQTQLTGKDLPNGKINSSISSNIDYDLASSKAKLTEFILQLDEINLKGDISVQTNNKTTVRFTLQGNEWDLNPYLAEPVKETTSTNKQATEANVETPAAIEQEPDLSFLNGLDVKGTLAIAGVKAADLTIGKIDTTVEINQGKAQLKPLTVNLYEGLLTINAWVDANKGANSYKLDSKLQDVQIRPLLIDAAEMDLVSGTTTVNFSASGKGLTTSKIKSGLAGSGDFKLLDGELYGINIPQKIRILKARLTGKPTPTEEDVKKTDFASLTGTFDIKKGIVDNNKLLLLSPVIRLDGSGLANILNESLDYKLSVTPLSKSDANTELKELNGITIPLLIKGSFTEPKFTLDTEGALKEELENRAKKELEKQKQKLLEKSQEELKEEGKKLEDKLKKELNKLFG